MIISRTPLRMSYEHELRLAAFCDPVESGEQSFDFGCSPVQFFGDE